MIKVYDITIRKLENGRMKRELPEFYELESVMQSNSWHDNHNMKEHTIDVLNNLETIVRENLSLRSALAKKVDTYTRQELLFLAATLHDIGKPETIQPDTSCPNHDVVGARKAGKILDRFDISRKERDNIINIIRNHDVLHNMLRPENAPNVGKDYARIKDDISGIFLEVLLLSYADTLNSHLKKTKPKEYLNRIDFFRKTVKAWEW